MTDRIRAAIRALFCRHNAINLTTTGKAAPTFAGGVEVLVEITCPCGYVNHRFLDITGAIQRDDNRRRKNG
jgi:hypothetical protein